MLPSPTVRPALLSGETPCIPATAPAAHATLAADDAADFSAAVLLVDDRPENLVALEATLAPLADAHGVRLLTAGSADEALRHALAEGDALAVALLDVDMPGTDGPEPEPGG